MFLNTIINIIIIIIPNGQWLTVLIGYFKIVTILLEKYKN